MLNGIRENGFEIVIAILAGAAMCLQRLWIQAGSIGWSLALILAIWHLYKQPKEARVELMKKYKGYTIAWLVCIFSMLPSLLFCDTFIGSLRELLEVWVYRLCPFFIVLVCFKDSKYFKKILMIYALFFCADNATALYQVFTKVTTRGNGFGGNSLNLSFLQAFVMPMLLIVLMDDAFSKKIKACSALVYIFGIMGMIAGGSRNAWLTVGVASFITMLCYVLQDYKKMLKAVAVCSIVGLFIYNAPYVQARLKSISDLSNNSNVARIMLWRGALAMAREHPLTGVGLGNFEREYKDQYHFKNASFHPHAHNTFFNILAETGVVGVLGYLYFSCYILFVNFMSWFHKRNPYNMMIWCGWLGFTLFGVFDYTFNFSAEPKIWWFLLSGILLLKEENNYDEK